jgi:hypothetical protein
MEGLSMAGRNAYARIVTLLFEQRFRRGAKRLAFKREDIADAANELGISPPKNLGDVLYSVRYRQGMPPAIAKTAPKGYEWRVVSVGKARHEFQLGKVVRIEPSPAMAKTKIPDATPGLVTRYALNDEQALLAIIRYNRLVDVFSGTTCYSLQNHLRTSVKGIGQIETDEIYVGVDRRGAHYVYPVQAKSGRDTISVVQIMQDIAMCREKYPNLICRPFAAQFTDDDTVALFELCEEKEEIRVVAEKHYALTPSEELSEDEVRRYTTGA